MKNVLNEMLRKYQTSGVSDKKNAIKEIMQEIVLCGLSRASFFQKTAFCRKSTRCHLSVMEKPHQRKRFV